MIGIKLKVVEPRELSADGLLLPVAEEEVERRDQHRDKTKRTLGDRVAVVENGSEGAEGVGTPWVIRLHSPRAGRPEGDDMRASRSPSLYSCGRSNSPGGGSQERCGTSVPGA